MCPHLGVDGDCKGVGGITQALLGGGLLTGCRYISASYPHGQRRQHDGHCEPDQEGSERKLSMVQASLKSTAGWKRRLIVHTIQG